MTTDQTTTERLAEAVEIILAYAPDWATTKTGKAVEKILREALAAHEAQRGQSFMDWFTRTAGGDMNMEHCERAWKAAAASQPSQPSLEREALEALRRLVKMYVANAGHKGHEFISCITSSHASDMTPAQRAKDVTWKAWDTARAVLAKADRQGQ